MFWGVYCGGKGVVFVVVRRQTSLGHACPLTHTHQHTSTHINTGNLRSMVCMDTPMKHFKGGCCRQCTLPGVFFVHVVLNVRVVFFVWCSLCVLKRGMGGMCTGATMVTHALGGIVEVFHSTCCPKHHGDHHAGLPCVCFWCVC